jgi:biotin carboxyl carrier protein
MDCPRFNPIAVSPGQAVQKGDLLLVQKAMKMLNRVLATGPGGVKEICVSEGDKIGKSHLMLKIEPE